MNGSAVAHDNTPLNPLRVFEIAARMGSFTRAAEELNVSQPAVSRQIATLEAYLSVRLFKRDRTSTALTPEGAEYYSRVSPALQTIAAATSDIKARQSVSPLRVKVYSTFAAKWLIPRLSRFNMRHPRVSIRIISAVAPVDFERDNVDVAIQLGDNRSRGVAAERLFNDVLQPVFSPATMPKPPGTIDEIVAHTLLHSQYRMRDWADWLAAAGRPDIVPANSMTFASSVLTYQAAIGGMGIAIGQPRLLQGEFASGQLKTLFHPVERELAYFVSWPTDRLQNFGLRAFVAWLRAESEAQEGPEIVNSKDVSRGTTL